ncbi:MAG: 2TM domain-containing protein [Turicibacter sp.]|nr:2TM domain-containing protein [Turicibacter sp.]
MATYNNDGVLTDEPHGEPIIIEPEDLTISTAARDEELMKLAKKRIEARHEIIVHTVSYFASIPLFLFMFVIWLNISFVFVIIMGGWFIGLATHWATFALSNNKDQQILHEYYKLKALSGD